MTTKLIIFAVQKQFVMFKFLLIIVLFILLLGFLLGFSIIRGLKNLLFGPGNRQQARPQNNNQRQYQQPKEERRDEEPHVKISRKLFESEAGEYVDYVEIKDEK